MHGNQQYSNGRIHEDVCVGKPGFMVVMVVTHWHVYLLLSPNEVRKCDITTFGTLFWESPEYVRLLESPQTVLRYHAQYSFSVKVQKCRAKWDTFHAWLTLYFVQKLKKNHKLSSVHMIFLRGMSPPASSSPEDHPTTSHLANSSNRTKVHERMKK